MNANILLLPEENFFKYCPDFAFVLLFLAWFCIASQHCQIQQILTVETLDVGNSYHSFNVVTAIQL